MKTLKFVLKNYTTKDGRTFAKASCLGKYLPTAKAQEDIYYTIKFVGGSCPAPTKDGIYEMAFEDKCLWIDTRAEYIDKHIVRVKATRIIFDKPLNN